jgi:hypothetical protein
MLLCCCFQLAGITAQATAAGQASSVVPQDVPPALGAPLDFSSSTAAASSSSATACPFLQSLKSPSTIELPWNLRLASLLNAEEYQRAVLQHGEMVMAPGMVSTPVMWIFVPRTATMPFVMCGVQNGATLAMDKV